MFTIIPKFPLGYLSVSRFSQPVMRHKISYQASRLVIWGDDYIGTAPNHLSTQNAFLTLMNADVTLIKADRLCVL